MLKSIAPKIGLFGLWSAVLLIGAGCVDHRCPRGYDQKGDTCYRIKDAGLDGATVDASGDDDPLEDAMLPALRPDAGSTEMDGGTDPDLDAMVEAQQQRDVGAVLPEPDGGTQPRPEDASNQVDPCKPNPCQNSGICSSEAGIFACICAEGYTGTNCELEVCGPTTIQSRADVENNRLCSEIRGDFLITAIGLAAIAADDFPYLSKITGSFGIAGFPTGNGPFLESVTLVSLRRIEGAVVVSGASPFSPGPLSELHLPALTSVGAGLLVNSAGVKVLDLPSLVGIGGDFVLEGLGGLCEVDFGKVQRIDGDLKLLLVPKLSATQLEPLRAATTGVVTESSSLGCCWPNGDDRVSCESFSSSDWSTYCTGC